MDREAAVLRAEMSQTRAELDHKLSLLQARVSEITPQRLTQRYMPEYFVDRLIGGILTAIGLKMAWSQYKWHHQHRDRVRARMIAYGSW
jgi:hypothetical protein